MQFLHLYETCRMICYIDAKHCSSSVFLSAFPNTIATDINSIVLVFTHWLIRYASSNSKVSHTRYKYHP